MGFIYCKKKKKRLKKTVLGDDGYGVVVCEWSGCTLAAQIRALNGLCELVSATKLAMKVMSRRRVLVAGGRGVGGWCH